MRGEKCTRGLGITTYEQALGLALIAKSDYQREIALERAAELAQETPPEVIRAARRNAKYLMKELGVSMMEYEDDDLDAYTLFDVWDHLATFSWFIWDAVASGDLVRIAELGNTVDRMAEVVLRHNKRG